MKRAIELARKGWPNCAPNPMVGCVIVHNNCIIGEGYHRKFGEAHAEIIAINSVDDKKLLKEATLYVTLEPCNHYGKTPPCTLKILECQIPRIVIGCSDPFNTKNQGGASLLRQSNLEVIDNVLSEQCAWINRRFNTFYKENRPYVILKWAQSFDGYLAPEDKNEYWITNEQSNQLNHNWRASEMAILVGRKTIKFDNPSLTTRLFYGKNPIRLVIDPNLSLDRKLNVFSEESPTYIFNSKYNSSQGTVHYVHLEFEENIPEQILKFLHLMNIQSLIVEGGSETINQFIQYGVWDETRMFTGKIEFGKGLAAPSFSIAPFIQKKVRNDLLSVSFNS